MCPLVIFLMANYGEGEPTDNAIDFNKWMTNINKTVRNTYLSNVSFTVFGLGNRQYEFFNRMGAFFVSLESLYQTYILSTSLLLTITTSFPPPLHPSSRDYVCLYTLTPQPPPSISSICSHPPLLVPPLRQAHQCSIRRVRSQTSV